MNTDTQLRFGIMVNSNHVQQWQRHCIDVLIQREGCELVLVIVNANADNPRGGLFSRLKNILFFVHRRLFCKVPASDLVDIGDLTGKVPELRCHVLRRGRYSQYFSKSDIDAIRSSNLDFILRFGFNIIRGDILDVARYGVWSFHHGDEMNYRGSPAAFWEVFEGNPVTGAILQRLTERLDGGVILRRGYYRTVKYSYGRNLQQVLWESAEWPAQVCRDINNGVCDYLSAPPSSTNARMYTVPGNIGMLVFWWRIAVALARYIYGRIFLVDEWNIGIVPHPISDFRDTGFLDQVQWLNLDGRHEFCADPFFWKKAVNKIHIVAERFSYSERVGEIVSISATISGAVENISPMLNTGSHMSYPYILKDGAEVYCIPETSAQGCVNLYHYDEASSRWKQLGPLLKDVALLDATVFRYNGYWWLFGTMRDTGSNLRLYIWFSDHLTGGWSEHANNPVKTSITSARPAGTPFVLDGRLYRPAQDCAECYGRAVVVNQVDTLTPYEFYEYEVAILEPSGHGNYTNGIHTLTNAGDITLIDGKRSRIDLRVALARAFCRLRRSRMQ